VLVAGAGALGSVFGGFLRRAGMMVTLLGRASHVQAIVRHGLHIDGIWGNHHVDGFAVATEINQLDGPFDLVLLPVKSYDTEDVCRAVVPVLADDGFILSLQNGLGNVEILESVAGAQRTIGARVIFGATLPAPGHARVTVFADPTAIGSLHAGRYPRSDEAAQRWAERISAAGVPAVFTDHLASLLWAKVFYNAALNPLGALLGVHYGALAEHDESRAIMDAAIDEAFRVASAESIELPWCDAAGYRQEFYDRLVPATYHHRSSMLQDLERGRRTEVDAINGAVWRRGAQLGIATPVNETLTRLIRLREKRK
jgi:2-dehydropantoate 2-reductase